MSYDENKKTKVKHLRALAERTKAQHDSLAGRVEALENAGTEANVLEGVKVNGTVLPIAEKMVDILIGTGTEDGSISVNGADVAVAGLKALAFKAEITEEELSEALKTVINSKAEASGVTDLTNKVAALVGEDTGKSARTIANEELAKQLIPENAKESMDTLAELAAWIQEHPDDASAMNAAITALQNLIGTIPEDAASTTIVAYIQEAVSAINIGNYYTKAEIDAMDATDEEVTEMLNEVFGE